MAQLTVQLTICKRAEIYYSCRNEQLHGSQVAGDHCMDNCGASIFVLLLIVHHHLAV
jgi:hypothetical protein